MGKKLGVLTWKKNVDSEGPSEQGAEENIWH
jgi:hypothetical protein